VINAPVILGTGDWGCTFQTPEVFRCEAASDYEVIKGLSPGFNQVLTPGK